MIQLRYLAPIADPRAESVAESGLRLHWLEAGLPPPELQWWGFNDLGLGAYRLDLALPEAKFGAEYNGEEFHSSDEDRESDEVRLTWLDEQRNWHIEVFDKSDVYAPAATLCRACSRASLSPAAARAAHVVPNAGVTRSPGSPQFQRHKVPGQRGVRGWRRRGGGGTRWFRRCR